MDDHQLLRQFRHGDTRAFEAFLERHEGGLLRTVTRLTGDASLAQDVVQETFLALLQEMGRSEGPTQPRAWLFQVARNRARDAMKKESRMRARQRSAATPEATRGVDGALALEEKDEACRVARHLETLPVDVVEVLSLKVLEGMSYREIATVTGHSLGKISALVHQGLKSLGGALRGTLSSTLSGNVESGKRNR